MAILYIPLATMYNWDNSLLSPIGQNISNQINPGILQDYILYRYGDYGVIITDIDFLKSSINNWCMVNTEKWKNLFATTQYDYNPIHNYDRTEEVTETITTTDNTTAEKNSTNTNTNSSNQSGNSQTSKAAFNAVTSATMQPVENSQNSQEISGNTSDTYNDKTSYENIGSNTRTLNTKTQGNIGVTTTQEMIQAERDILQYNLYTVISDEFRDVFLDCCVG